MSRRAGIAHARWWQVPQVVSHVNRLVSGVEEPGRSRGLHRRLRAELSSDGSRDGIPFPTAVSVGGGIGKKEMDLLDAGLVGSFDVFELSPERIERGRALAEERGLSSRIRFTYGDPFEDTDEPRYHMVHWNNSLHHMLDVQDAVRWSHNVLLPGGLFYMDDFVGPNRFQWSDLALSIATAVRRQLPERYLVSPRDPTRHIPRRVRRPDLGRMLAADPSEAADSEAIATAVRKNFPGADLIPTGGVIYHLALSDVLANFDVDRSEDRARLSELLRLDELCLSIGGLETHYAVCLARKPEHAHRLPRPALGRRLHRWRRAGEDRADRVHPWARPARLRAETLLRASKSILRKRLRS